MYELNDEQQKLLKDNHYRERPHKPGLWYKVILIKVVYIDFRPDVPMTYSFLQGKDISKRGDDGLLKKILDKESD